MNHHSKLSSINHFSTSTTFLIFCFLIVFTACQTQDKTTEAESNKAAEAEDWITLFNGKDLSGWDIKLSGYDLNDNYNETFVVEDSMIRVKYDNYDEFNDAFGHMYYKDPFSYYKLVFDYRFVGDQLKGGATWNVRNSGVMLHSQSAESNEFDQDFPVSIELQLLGGLNEGERYTGNVCTPGTAVVMGDTVNYNHCINSTSKTYNGDQWVHVEAIVLGGESMSFIIEGDTVLSFDQPQITKGFIDADGESVGEDWGSFGVTRDEADWVSKGGEVITEGYIALQAESHPIDFKNIKLLNLCGCKDEKAKNYKSYYLKDAPELCEY
ncbi:3-keto-disaccharide hydrolase [Chondrinema litorale]|uniref:3-keto-disaccharide hydrolase n=1 Tax=Chondrinema litorale TaxID=2994555 RepID=UPI00254293C9|nr:DUF1080 domain-containing protein [Chondrinema litorale]UZR92435.1 DUF1080 domain-containing protein [Chondrinema litorale]